ncbi:MAG TPA: hypothetical protein VI958_10645, partial [Acidobacteriota bacterium]
PVEASPAQDSIASSLGMSKDDLIAKLLTDPDAVVEQISKKVIEKVDQRTQDRITVKQGWEAFYGSNPDLADFKDIVALKANELRKQWLREKKDLSWADGSKVLAEAARTLIKRVRGSEAEVEEVGSNARVVSSSGSPAPRKPVKDSSVSTGGFVGQIQKLQQAKGL